MARFLVDAPPAAPSADGLLSAATVRDDVDLHLWESGVEWDSSCKQGFLGMAADGCADVAPGDPPNPTPKDDQQAVTGFGLGQATPFTVYGVHRCSTGGRTGQEHQDQAIASFTRADTRTIEAIVERGGPTADGSLGPLTWALAASANPVSAGTPQTVEQAIATLESASGDNVGTGVFHMARAAAQMAFTAGAIVRDRNGKLVTGLGTPVVAGAGYYGAGPGGAPSGGVATIYWTGPVIVYRSQPIVVGEQRDRIDRRTNTVSLVVERQVIVGWDCTAFRQPVDLGYDPVA